MRRTARLAGGLGNVPNVCDEAVWTLRESSARAVQMPVWSQPSVRLVRSRPVRPRLGRHRPGILARAMRMKLQPLLKGNGVPFSSTCQVTPTASEPSDTSSIWIRRWRDQVVSACARGPSRRLR